MVRLVDPVAEYPATSVVAGAFALLVAAAWFASLPGISIAVAYYGAVLLSERLYCRWRASNSRRHRALRLLGLALTWLSVLAYSAVLLPSNFSTAVI
jgi:dolichol kinase